MRLLSLLFISFYFATIHAFPNLWVSEATASTEHDPSAYGDTFITLHPIDINNPEQIFQTETNLENICGPEHVKTLRAIDGRVSWNVTLTDRETLRHLPEHPWVRFDEAAKTTLVDFTKRHEKRSDVGRRDDPYYNVVARDYNNDEETRATRIFLQTKITNPNQRFLDFKYPGTDHIIGWGNLQLSDKAKAEVEAYQGVTAPVGKNDLCEEDRCITTNPRRAPDLDRKKKAFGMISTAFNSLAKRAAIVKRAVTWTKQVRAGWDIVMVSQPKEMKNNQLVDFVYDHNAGEGTWIYVIDGGVAYTVMNNENNREFAIANHILLYQTQNSIDAGEASDTDDSNISHGTMVASKALGQKYGVAKKATLVSVKMRKDGTRTVDDFIQALDLVANDLASNTNRIGRSVIVASHGFPNEEGNAALMRPIFERLFDWGVPFVSSSGNLGRVVPNINRLPKLMEGPDFPIINVGAADNRRQKSALTQAGPHLNLYAPGGSDSVKLTGQSKVDRQEQDDCGTSFAAPLVAAVIATYFNYVPLPWDGTKTGKERVQEIKDFLMSDASSWEDTGTARSLWNGATKANRESAGARLFGGVEFEADAVVKAQENTNVSTVQG